jgi:hypothetical protein
MKAREREDGDKSKWGIMIRRWEVFSPPTFILNYLQ